MTLVETVVAVGLIGIGMAGACAVMLYAHKLSETAHDHYTAITISKNRLERARELEYSALSSLAETKTTVDSAGAPSASGNYRRTTVVSNVTATLTEVVVATEIKDRVTLSFKGEGETLRTLLTEYEEVP